MLCKLNKVYSPPTIGEIIWILIIFYVALCQHYSILVIAINQKIELLLAPLLPTS